MADAKHCEDCGTRLEMAGCPNCSEDAFVATEALKNAWMEQDVRTYSHMQEHAQRGQEQAKDIMNASMLAYHTDAAFHARTHLVLGVSQALGHVHDSVTHQAILATAAVAIWMERNHV